MLLFAALAMASKSSTVILPGVLCLGAWWVEGRWRWRNLTKVAPVILMSLIASGLSLWTQRLILATTPDPQWVRTWPERVVTAGNAIWFYLGKLLWPHPLVMIYPRWQINAGQWFSYLPLLAVLVILCILWLNRESWSRPWFFVFAYFLITLLPVLGLVDNLIFRYSLVFDHFQYLASMGPLALAGSGLARLTTFDSAKRLWLQSILGGGLLLMLGLCSWQRAWVYESPETLWADTLSENPSCWAAYTNLGNTLAQKGNINEAIEQYQKALELNPHSVETRIDLGLALVKNNQVGEAIVQYQKALEIDPQDANARYDFGNALLQKRDLDHAIVQFEEALKINPNKAQVHNNLGSALLQKGQMDEAMKQFQKAAEIDPNYADAHNDLGIVLFQKGRLDEGIAQFREAVRLDPHDSGAQTNLAKAQAMAQQRSIHK